MHTPETLRPSVLSSAVDYTNSHFCVRHDRLRWPNGHEAAYFVIEGNPFVTIIAQRGDKIAMVEQYRYTVDQVTLEFPKGGIEPGESPIEAARRELLEESDCTAEALEPLGTIACSIGNSRKQCHIFLAKDSSPTGKAEHKDATEDDLRCRWFTADELRSMIRAGKIIDQDSLAAWTVYCER